MIKIIFPLALVVAACSTEPAKTPESTTTVTSASMTTPSDTQTSASEIATTEAPQATPPQPTSVATVGWLNDPQIAAITTAVSTQLEQSKLALRHATDRRVSALAQLVVDQHKDAKLKMRMLETSNNLEEQPSATSTQIGNDAQTGLTSLNGEKGANFDIAYLQLQITEQRQLLDLLDAKLIPSAQSPDLKHVLVMFRPRVADLLQRAQDLQQTLSNE